MNLRALVFYLFLSLWALVGAGEPQVVYLTWTDDPTSTMTIQWHTAAGTGETKLNYRLKDEKIWSEAAGELKRVQGTDVDVHTIHLEGLKEDSVYTFKLEGSQKKYTFNTMPETLHRPVRMVIGGDAFHVRATELFHRMCRMIAFQDPDFIVVGGDLAYANKVRKQFIKNRKWEMARWQGFLKGLQCQNEEGRLVPMLPVIGNHDIAKPKYKTDEPEMWDDIFALPRVYRSMNFGNYLSLVLLDSGHIYSIHGEQVGWLDQTLKEGQNATYQIVAYHEAAYPSHYSYTMASAQNLRKYWVPLFEKYGVRFAFEHDNHTYKRTHPIKNGKVDPTGVTYLGDGSWGVAPRKVKSPSELWYLHTSASVNACYVVTITEEKCLVEAKNTQGEVVDRVEFPNQALQLQ